MHRDWFKIYTGTVDAGLGVALLSEQHRYSIGTYSQSGGGEAGGKSRWVWRLARRSR
jgi:hypothetical protein